MDDRHPSRAAAVSLVVAIVAAAAAVALGQTPAARAFEATSIRRNPSDSGPHVAMMRGQRFLAPNTSVRDLIRVAHLVEELQISGGPQWTDSDRFSVEATTAAAVTADDARSMVRSLLADRFKLATHTEKRDLQGFALISMGRGSGEGRRPSGAQCAPIRPPTGAGAPPPPPPPPAGGGDILPLTAGAMISKCGSMLAPGYVSARMITIEQLAVYLSRMLRKPVFDRTGLTGPFDIDLVFLPESQTPGQTPFAPDAPSLFTAVQEQLGLKLDPQRVPTDVIVVDSVERPTEN